jgi:hypothetical protein
MAVREKDLATASDRLLEPSSEHRRGALCQGCAPFLAPLAMAPNVGTGTKRHGGTVKAGQLGEPQTGLEARTSNA